MVSNTCIEVTFAWIVEHLLDLANLNCQTPALDHSDLKVLHTEN